MSFSLATVVKDRLNAIQYTRRHRKEVQRIAHGLGYSFPFHDFLKMLNIAIFGDKIATKLHRRFSHHHLQNGDIKNKIEAAIDWESARFTKPDKPLNAFDTWKTFYPEVDMGQTMDLLGFGPSKKV